MSLPAYKTLQLYIYIRVDIDIYWYSYIIYIVNGVN